MIAGKAKAYPSEATFDLRKFVNYGQKIFYNIGPWSQCYKTFLSVIYKFS